MCDNEMSFSMMPQLSIKKSRFAKASLRTRYARHRSWGATCRLPNRRAGTLSYPMLAWDTHLPNGCFGRQASQSVLVATSDIVQTERETSWFSPRRPLWCSDSLQTFWAASFVQLTIFRDA